MTYLNTSSTPYVLMQPMKMIPKSAARSYVSRSNIAIRLLARIHWFFCAIVVARASLRLSWSCHSSSSCSAIVRSARRRVFSALAAQP